jgi:hypothetical protein
MGGDGDPERLQHDPTHSRTQFGHYLPNGVNPAHNFRGYQQHVGVVAGNLHAVTLAANQTLKGGRVETGRTTHTRYRITPTAATVASLQNAAAPPNALVVGHRVADQWTFYRSAARQPVLPRRQTFGSETCLGRWAWVAFASSMVSGGHRQLRGCDQIDRIERALADLWHTGDPRND